MSGAATAAGPTLSSLAYLPTELYEAILDQIEPAELQRTTFSLRLALPRSPVPLHQLFKHVVITSRAQTPKFWLSLEASAPANGRDRAAANWVQSFELATFDVDADILYNALSLVPRIRYLHLNIGTTFAPEHLDDIFRKPKEDLKCLSLRFRPYVEKATYYQFLKGQYSDILVEDMTRWLENRSLTHISMVQDPLPAIAFDPQTSFAQPIVFFSLEVFRSFSCSPLLKHVTHLRLRVPSRMVIAHLVEPRAFPALRVLDIASTALDRPERVLPVLFARHAKLEHLILDDCSLSRETWRDLARACALAGQSKSRAREKKVNEWLETINARQQAHSVTDAPNANAAGGGNIGAGAQQGQARRARAGRRGVATAAFSIRAGPSNASSAASSSSTAQSAANPNPGSATATQTPARKTKIRILPPLPTLLTFSTKLNPPPDATKADEWRAEWEAGWRGGIEVLLGARARLRTSLGAVGGHVRVMRFADDADMSDDGNEEGLAGLVDVKLDDESVWGSRGSDPLVCFGEIRRGRPLRPTRVVEVDEDDSSEEETPLGTPSPGSPVESASEGENDVELSNNGSSHNPSVADRGSASGLPRTSQKAIIRDNGHVCGCGHEIHAKAWDIYERFKADSPL
ncbi:hypothetical protein DL93DRAFT_97166 [Clavulina sp. PMI_390]|nr:hypothetical protein DL93DRAFT_97166 [Clavulina sp. PMI_390]